MTGVRARRAVLGAIVLLGVLLCARGLGDEGAVSLQGDMPRYMMNGVFLYDYLVSGSPLTPSGAFGFAEHYYARYPALSLGHHPPLVAATLAPAYALFGVSVFWSRIVILGFFVLAAGALYSLARRLYDPRTAALGTALFVTNGAVIATGQVVMTEMAMLALVLLAAAFLVRFRDTGRARDYAGFIVAAAGSLYAKQLAVFVAPAYFIFLVGFVGVRRLLRKEIALLTLLGVVLCIPIAVLTWVMSPMNVALVQFVATEDSGLSLDASVVWSIVRAHLTMPMVFAAVAGGLSSVVHRDRRILLSVTWLASTLIAVSLTTGSMNPAHYGMIAVPAYFLAAASLVGVVRSIPARQAGTALLVLVAMWQVWTGRHVRPVGADGYEAAAQYVLSQGASPTILFSGPVDTGYFIFFVRKHDPLRRHVVLRADKLFTTSRLDDLNMENRITDRQEIYGQLRTFGTRYIVVEDIPTDARVIEWVREELKTSRFIERKRIPIVSADRRLRDANLVIYEYRDAQPPDSRAEVVINVPLVGRGVRVPLADLIAADRE
jgi:hypothetical protein